MSLTPKHPQTHGTRTATAGMGAAAYARYGLAGAAGMTVETFCDIFTHKGGEDITVRQAWQTEADQRTAYRLDDNHDVLVTVTGDRSATAMVLACIARAELAMTVAPAGGAR